MPRVRRRARVRVRHTFDLGCLANEQLETGADWHAEFGEPSWSDEELSAYWHAYAPEIIATWTRRDPDCDPLTSWAWKRFGKPKGIKHATSTA